MEKFLNYNIYLDSPIILLSSSLEDGNQKKGEYNYVKRKKESKKKV